MFVLPIICAWAMPCRLNCCSISTLHESAENTGARFKQDEQPGSPGELTSKSHAGPDREMAAGRVERGRQRDRRVGMFDGISGVHLLCSGCRVETMEGKDWSCMSAGGDGCLGANGSAVGIEYGRLSRSLRVLRRPCLCGPDRRTSSAGSRYAPLTGITERTKPGPLAVWWPQRSSATSYSWRQRMNGDPDSISIR